jgi:hypothetical protein
MSTFLTSHIHLVYLPGVCKDLRSIWHAALPPIVWVGLFDDIGFRHYGHGSSQVYVSRYALAYAGCVGYSCSPYSTASSRTGVH